MHKEKISKLQEGLVQKTEEIKKLKNRIATLKISVTKLEQLSKKPSQIDLKPNKTVTMSDLVADKSVSEAQTEALGTVSRIIIKEASQPSEYQDKQSATTGMLDLKTVQVKPLAANLKEEQNPIESSRFCSTGSMSKLQHQHSQLDATNG